MASERADSLCRASTEAMVRPHPAASLCEDSGNLTTDFVLVSSCVLILLTIKHPTGLVKMPNAESLDVYANIPPSILLR